MPKSEAEIQREILEWSASRPDIRLFRNNVGVLEDKYGNKIRFGLAKGSADIIGMVKVYSVSAISFDGPIAKFLSIEVKRPGKKPTSEQEAWGRMVQAMGGIHIVATSVADVEEALR